MTEYCYIERAGDEYRKYTFGGDPVDQTANPKSPCMVSSRDVSVKFIDIPKIGSRYLDEILRYKIRSLYPGVPEDTVMDYRILRRNKSRYAAVFIGTEKTVSEYRKVSKGRPLFHAFGIIEKVSGFRKNSSCVFVFFHYTWIEAAAHEDGGFTLSFTIARTKNTAVDLARVSSMLPAGLSRAQRVFLYHEKSALHLEPELREYGEREGIEIVLSAIERHLPHNDFRRPWIFRLEHTGRKTLARVSLPILVIFELLLVSILLNREITHHAVMLEELRLFQEEAMGRYTHVRRLMDEIDTAEEDLQAMRERRPIDLFFLLTELTSLIGGKAIVTELTFEGGLLQVHGLSLNALSLLPQFSESSVFSDCKIIQVISDQRTDWERFTLHATVQFRHYSEK
ncbi:MAG: hypothetical protein JXQ30_09485 [Spirochaetes bacterium]|nr:hypothetical protein [Spirochaetota bacterium]